MMRELKFMMHSKLVKRLLELIISIKHGKSSSRTIIQSHKCNCPTCRMARGEITPNEYAWYLKGRIESIARIIKSKSDNNFGKEDYQFKDLDQELRCTLMDDEACLSMLLKDKFKLKRLDKAFLHPREFMCMGIQ